MDKKVSIARVIRGIAVPAAWVGLLLVLLYILRPSMFNNILELLLSIVFLAIIPMAAYALQPFIPKFKDKGREGKRNLAFIFTSFGYTMAVLYGLTAQVTTELLFVFIVYFLSYLVLLISNKVIKFRASGHACGLFGPVVMLAYYIGWQIIIPGGILLVLVWWASLFLKRHTIQELIGGCVSFIIALFSSLFIMTLFA
jgi:hypothetical protein